MNAPFESSVKVSFSTSSSQNLRFNHIFGHICKWKNVVGYPLDQMTDSSNLRFISYWSLEDFSCCSPDCRRVKRTLELPHHFAEAELYFGTPINSDISFGSLNQIDT